MLGVSPARAKAEVWYRIMIPVAGPARVISLMTTLKALASLRLGEPLSVTITEPPGNVAPVPTFLTNCIALVCGTSSTGTVDPNLGDVITYSWNWGDGSLATTGASGSHTYATVGTYTVTMTATDGWLRSASTTRVLNLVEPVTNVAPVPTFTTSCVALACLMNSAGTVDPNGDVIRYSWDFGDGTAVSTAVGPSHTYLLAGTYTITLTVTDGWNKFASTTRQVTVP